MEKKYIKTRMCRVTIFGCRRVIEVPEKVDNKTVSDVITYTFSSIAHSVYIDYTLADMLMILFKDYLVGKGLYRMKMKKLFNDTQKNLRQCMGIIESSSAEDYFNEIACIHYDNVKGDIKKMREMVSTKLANLGVKNAGLCGWLVLVHNFILVSSDHFNMVFNRIYERTGVDLSRVFDMVQAKGAYKSSAQMLNDTMGDDVYRYRHNIVENKEIGKLFKQIFSKVYSQKNYIKVRDEVYYDLPDEIRERWPMNKQEEEFK